MKLVGIIALLLLAIAGTYFAIRGGSQSAAVGPNAADANATASGAAVALESGAHGGDTTGAAGAAGDANTIAGRAAIQQAPTGAAPEVTADPVEPVVPFDPSDLGSPQPSATPKTLEQTFEEKYKSQAAGERSSAADAIEDLLKMQDDGRLDKGNTLPPEAVASLKEEMYWLREHPQP